MDDLPLSPTRGGVRLAVRLTPRASQDGVDGAVVAPGGRPTLQLRIAAPPVEGAANAALVAFLARVLRLRRSAIRIVSGKKSRLKLLELTGDPAASRQAVTSLIAQAKP